MKVITMFALMLALALPAWAQDVPLTPAGDGVKTVVVATKFPFTISAPPGAALYVWRVPAGVAYAEADDTITVTAAPAGDLLVTVTTVSVDFDAKKIVKKTGKVTVAVGDVPPPDPVDPETSTLTRHLRTAYAADTDADKAKSLAFLQAAYAAMAANPKAGLATNLDCLNWLKSVIEAPGVGLSLAQLNGVRRVIGDNLNAAMGTAPNTPANMPLLKSQLAKIANALKGVK